MATNLIVAIVFVLSGFLLVAIEILDGCNQH